jgi:hypothetical protein
VTAVQDGGLEVKFVDHRDLSFIRRSDLARDRDEQRPERFSVGQKVDARVTQFDKKTARSACRSRRWKSPKRRKPWRSSARPTPAHRSATFWAQRYCRTPVTGWIVNVPVQAGGRPPGACRNVRRDDGGGGAPAGSAGSRITTQDDRPSQPPDKSSPLVPGQRRPAVRVRVETGLWRAALRMRGGHGVKTPWPWRSRIVNARPSPCRTMPPAADRCPCPGGRTRHATACRMRTSSGEARAAREPRHRLLIFSEGKARGRPSGIDG